MYEYIHGGNMVNLAIVDDSPVNRCDSKGSICGNDEENPVTAANSWVKLIFMIWIVSLLNESNRDHIRS